MSGRWTAAVGAAIAMAVAAAAAAGCEGAGEGAGVAARRAAATAAVDYDYDLAGVPARVGARVLAPAGSGFTAGGVSYALDALGRVARAGDLELAYGPDGQLATARRGAAIARYVHDERGQRLARIAPDGAVELFLDGGGRVDDEGVVELVAVDGRVVGVLDDAGFRAVPVDGRGTRTDAGGALAPAAPHGERAAAPGDDALAFARARRDAVTGMIRLGARDYDPWSYRFAQPDPLLLEQPELCVDRPAECNLYGYARNNPVDFIDPTGLAGEDADGDDDGDREGGAPLFERFSNQPPAFHPSWGLPQAKNGYAFRAGVTGHVYRVQRAEPFYLLGDRAGHRVSADVVHTGPYASAGLYVNSKEHGTSVGAQVGAMRLSVELEACAYLCVSVTPSVGLGAGARVSYKDGQVRAGAMAGLFGVELGFSVEHSAPRNVPPRGLVAPTRLLYDGLKDEVLP